MPLTDDELSQRAEAERLLCTYHLGRSTAFDEARSSSCRQGQNPAGGSPPSDSSPAAPKKAITERGRNQRIVLEVMRPGEGRSFTIHEISQESRGKGKDLSRVQVRTVLQRLHARGIVAVNGAEWRILSIAEAIVAMDEEDPA